MLTVWHRQQAEPLAADLAGVLAEPPDDPMTQEWVAVATLGMRRWLALELARSLGASAPGRGDGVTANIAFPFPGALRQAILDAAPFRGAPGARGATRDPWQVDRLVWAVLDVLEQFEVDADRRSTELGPLAALPAGATRYGQARRLADLFDHYAVHRPELVLEWHAGKDVGPAGRELAHYERWQPRLWRLVRERIGSPSPPERLPGLLDELRAGQLAVDLPTRLAVFGITTLPGGADFLPLVHALAATRQVHLLLLDPSVTASRRVLAAARGRWRSSTAAGEGTPAGSPAAAGTPAAAGSPAPAGTPAAAGTGTAAGPGGARAASLRRADDHSGELVRHPLLRSWGRPYRERTVMLAAAEARGLLPAGADASWWPPAPPGDTAPQEAPPTLLARLQHDLRRDLAPAGDFTLAEDDRSIQSHACFGRARQVDALRDALLHLLADDPTLQEDDIVVLCPAIERFAPLVAASFGPPAAAAGSPAAAPGPATGAPRLRYRISDRSLSETSPLLGALDALLALAAGRGTAEDVQAFVALGPVRARFSLGEAELATIAGWTEGANVRWGFDAAHRQRWGMPPDLGANSWRAALDRVLTGVALSDDGLELGPGGIAPLGVESTDIALAGRFADLVSRLEALAAEMAGDRAIAGWCALIEEACEDLFDAGPGGGSQRVQLRRMLDDLRAEAVVGDAPSGVALTLADVRRLLGAQLGGTPRRPDFFRGGITLTSLSPLRWVPFRVVCLLGLDEDPGGSGGSGDDLTVQAPRLGDPDRRVDFRQSLLEAVLAAGDHLVITRSGHDLRTNQPVPASVAFAELRDTVAATLAPDDASRFEGRIELVHPRQPFDRRCFEAGGTGLLGQAGVPWSFDRAALGDALAREAGLVAGGLPVPGGGWPAPGGGLPTPGGGWPVPFLDRPLPAPADSPPVVALADLKSFLTDPTGFFLRRRLGIQLPPTATPWPDDLPTELDGLQRWQLADRLLAALAAGRDPDDWRRHERALGSLPAGGLGEAVVDQVIAEVTELVAAGKAVGLDPSDDQRLPIDVALADGTRVVGTVTGCGPAEADGAPGERGPGERGPGVVTFSRAPKRRLAAWLDLMALVAAAPDQRWRSVVVNRSASGKEPEIFELRPRGSGAAGRRRTARHALDVAVDCFRRGQREPLPLFEKLSWGLNSGRATAADWRSDYAELGDGDDEWTRLAFDDVDYAGLLAIEARPDDPPGAAPGRAQRFADYLWGELTDSTEAGS